MRRGLGQTHKFDPTRKDQSRRVMFGSFGVYPWEPCRSCGGEEFYVMDWDMGYFCVDCDQVFGTKEEWAK